jgi:hypothetical protein
MQNRKSLINNMSIYTKICKTCEEINAYTDYFVGNTLNANCNKCRKKYAAKYRSKNREKLYIEQQNRYIKERLENPKGKTKIPTSNIYPQTKELIVFMNSTIIKTIKNTRKRKYHKNVLINNATITDIDYENKIMVLKLGKEQMEEIEKQYLSFVGEFSLEYRQIRKLFRHEDEIICVFNDIVFLDDKYKEIIDSQKIRADCIVAGDLVINYQSSANSIIFIMKYIKEPN